MSNKNKGKQGLVYSTNPNFSLPKNEEPEIETLPPAKQMLKVFRDKKQRGGKEVTLIDGFVGNDTDIEKLGKELKAHCGTGGSVKDGQILVQGDQRQKVCAFLEKKGYKFKLAGG